MQRETESETVITLTLKIQVKHMNGWPLCARLCVYLEDSPESNSVQILLLLKSFGRDYKPKAPMCIPLPVTMHMQKDHIHTLKILQS